MSGSTTAASSSSSTSGSHASSSSSSSSLSPKPTKAVSKTKTAAKHIPTSTTTTTSLGDSHAVTSADAGDGSIELHAPLTEGSSTDSTKKGSSGTGDDSKCRTYEIVSEINPVTGDIEYSMVWIEITEKGNPKRFLGYLGFKPSDTPSEPSETAQAISTLVKTAGVQNANFGKSSAQTTLQLKGKLPDDSHAKNYKVAILKRGKEEVTLDSADPDVNNAIETLQAAIIDKERKIIKPAGADFDPRDKAADAGNGQKKDPRDITKEEINKESLGVYLDRVQEGSSKIRLHPVTPLSELNSPANKKIFEGVQDKPLFIPVEVTPNSYVYLCKDGKELYYFNPRNITDIQNQKDGKWVYGYNDICNNDSSPIGKELHKFACNYRIKELHVPTKTYENSSTQALGIQWLAHLSKLSSINNTNAFFPNNPEEITVPEPSSGAALSAKEKADKKAETKEKGEKAVEEPPELVAQPTRSCHEIFDNQQLAEHAVTTKQKNDWLNKLHNLVLDSKQDADESLEDTLQKFTKLVTTKQTQSHWFGLRSNTVTTTWNNTTERGQDALLALQKALYPNPSGAITTSAEERAFHAKVLDTLVNNPELSAAFCARKSPWGAPVVVPAAADPSDELDG